MFRKAKRMAKLGKTFGECQEKHPEVWKLGNNLADEIFATRSDYMREETRTREGADKYIRLAGEHLLTSLSDGTLGDEFGIEFPEPVTDSSAKCLGIAFSTRLVDLFEMER